MSRESHDEAQTAGEKWQPISTVPRRGTRVLVFVPSSPYMNGHIDIAAYNQHSQPRASHWMPLPAPPEAK